MSFASVFDRDPATGDVVVVLMTEDGNNGWLPDWKAAYMIPSDVVEACKLKGILSMVWDGAAGTWRNSMSSSLYEKQKTKGKEAMVSWFDNKDAHNVRTKKELLSASLRAAQERLKQLYEGQMIMYDGHLAEVRGLEKADESQVFVLPYEHVENLSTSSSAWKLSATSRVQRVSRTAVSPVDWKVDWKTMTVTMFMPK